MSAHEIKVTITPLCPSCGKESHSGGFVAEDRHSQGIFDRDNPYARTDQRIFVSVCQECFIHRSDLESLIDVVEAYAHAEEALANREYQGINAEPHGKLQARVHSARRDLEAALAAARGAA